MANADIFNFTDTWNAGGTTFAAIKVNVTNTASAAASALLQMQVDSADVFAVRKDGVITAGGFASPFAVIGTSTAGAEIRLPEDTDNGSHYVALKAPDSLAGTYTLTFPADDGASGEVLSTNGSGVLSWAAAGGASAPLTLASGTLTDPSTALAITATYNDAADTFKSLTIAISNTNSAAASRPFEILTGASGTTSVFSVDTAGGVRTVEYFRGDFYDNRGFAVVNNSGNSTISVGSASTICFKDGVSPFDGNDSILCRAAAGVLGVRGSSTSTGGGLNFLEQTAPSAPSSNEVVLYAEDNGSGKTRLMARFNTGAAQQVAIEP